MSILVARRGSIHRPSTGGGGGGDGYRDAVLADSPVMYLRLGESSGTTAADEMSTHPGTYSGVVLGATGLITASDTAVEFDHTTDYVEVADHADFEGNTFTFECWIKHSDPDADRLSVVADKTALASANNSWGVWYENRSSQGSPQSLRFFTKGLAAAWSGAAVASALAAGGHLVCIKSGSNAAIYWDGVSRNTGSTANTVSGNALPLRIGQIANNTTFGWTGVVDEVAFYTSAFNAGQVEAHYDAGTA